MGKKTEKPTVINKKYPTMTNDEDQKRFSTVFSWMKKIPFGTVDVGDGYRLLTEERKSKVDFPGKISDPMF